MEPENNMTTNPDPATQSPSTPQQASPTTGGGSNEESAMGPMIGVIVIVLLLVAGGFYYYMQESGSGSKTEETELTAEEQAAQDQAEVDAIAEQSTSSAFSAIEADFNATDASSLDNTLNSIDSELVE